MEDNNMGLLLHKLTKYQTLHANTDDMNKKSVYQQKIEYYNNKMTQIGIERQNLNNLNNLVGGEVYNTQDLLVRLTSGLPSRDDKEAKDKETELNKKIDESEKLLGTINSHYNNIIDTIHDVMTKLQEEIQKRGSGTCPNIEEAKKKLEILHKNLETLSTETGQQKFMEKINKSNTKSPSSSSSQKKQQKRLIFSRKISRTAKNPHEQGMEMTVRSSIVKDKSQSNESTVSAV